MPSRASHAAPELLAPAGSPDPFFAALAAGADAIYCGMGSFNARRKAENFTDESFAEACRIAHLAGARVYVTVNIVIKDEEMADALELVRRCAALGADAFIIQDWGLFFEIRRLMPGVETHISTQANIHDARGTRFCAALGADRVTLSRELSVAEIAQIAETGVELEVFAHGSICFSYSGVCLLSSFACAGRSANRGMCAQPCRLPYELLDERGRSISAPGRERALCPRDTSTAEMLGELVAAGAGALKIEGRMKAPDYVYAVVDAYRRELDDILAARSVAPEERRARARQLKRAFNRDFTTAYQRGESGDEMMSYERSNNRGQVVGEVLESRTVGSGLKRKLHPEDRRNKLAVARLALTEPIGAGDLIELRHDDEFDRYLTFTAEADAAAGDEIEVRIPRAVPAGARVRVIRSQRAIETAAAALKRDQPRRRPVRVAVRARVGEPFSVALTCTDGPSLTAVAEGFTVECARTRPVGRDDLIEHVGRMGASPFLAESFEVELDEGVGMGFSAVHRVRARACELLEEAILAPVAARGEAVAALPAFTETAVTAASAKAGEDAGVVAVLDRARAAVARVEAGTDGALGAGGSVPAAAGVLGGDAAGSVATPEICAIAGGWEAVDTARAAGATRFYLATDALDEAGIAPEEAVAAGVVPILDEVCREGDRERLDRWVLPGAPVAVGNISELALAAERGARAEIRPCIPMHNVAAAAALSCAGAAGFWLTPELTLCEIERVAPMVAGAVGVVAIGRPRVMTSEHCILMAAGKCIHDCPRCGLRRRRLSLKNIDGKILPVRTDVHGRSHLYEDGLIDLTPQMGKLVAAGVTRFMVDGTLMDDTELERALAQATRAAAAVRAGRAPARRMPGATSGVLFVGVQ
ncbi:MAG: U32 family peptidase [Coriobacteriaceae bacterium]|nr:U32 family peptidase [Coriobacteriaceae bacterium]